MEKAVALQQLTDLFKAAREQQEWGGSEDEEGTLHPGIVDLDELEAKIRTLIEVVIT